MQRGPNWVHWAIVTGIAIGILLLGLVAAILLMARVRDVLEVLAVALLISIAVNPAVDWLQGRRIPRLLSVILILLLVLAVFILVIILLIPPLIEQGTAFARNLPDYWQALHGKVSGWLRGIPSLQRRWNALDLGSLSVLRVETVISAAGRIAGGVVRGLAAILLVLLASLFMLAYPKPLLQGLVEALPPRHEERARNIGEQIAVRLRAWTLGIVILSVVMGAVTGLGLFLIGIPYALLFGLLAGLLEVVPTLGPILAAILPTAIGLSISPWLGLGVVVLFIVLQQLESQILTPSVMSRQLEVHPLSALIALLVMAGLLGVFGAVIALPTLAVLKVLYFSLYVPWVQRTVELRTPEALLEEASYRAAQRDREQ